MSLDDPRPRPQYGEYATPEQQRALMGEPVPAPLAAPDVSQLMTPTGSVAVPARSRNVDRVITILLLLYGVFTVATLIPELWHFQVFAQLWMKLMQAPGEFTNIAGGNLWGRIAAVVAGVGWALTALLAWNRMSRKKIAWWIPLVGGAITMILISVCAAVALLGDPAILDFLKNMR